MEYDYGSNPEYSGPLGVDYYYLFVSLPPKTLWLGVITMLVWVCFLMNLVAQSASNYFSPTLNNICMKLKMRYDIAGITFLALGNGAPDFFSLIASFSGDVDVLVGVGALLGGSCFVCTVVVGTIAIYCPCEVNKNIFLRDISFHLTAVFSVIIIAIIKHVTFFVALMLLVLYLLYVGIVVTSAYYSNDSDETTSGREISMQNLASNNFSNTIQSAFWHLDKKALHKKSKESKKKSKTGYSKLSSNESTIKATQKKQEYYSFVILSNDNEKESTSTDHGGHKNDDEEEGGMIDLSGAFEPDFDDIIQEDYYSVKTNNDNIALTTSQQNKAFKIIDEDDEEEIEERFSEEQRGTKKYKEDKVGASLTQSLLNNQDDLVEESANSVSEASAKLNYVKALKQRNSSKYSSMLSTLYWQQWALRSKFRHAFQNSEWDSYPLYYKAYLILEYPITFLRDITIPTLDEANWNKLYALCHPFACPLFVMFIFGYVYESVIDSLIYAVCIALAPTFIIYIGTQNSKPPTQTIFVLVWTLTAFVMCVCWVYFLAGELLTALSVLGKVLKLPPAFLGLTILAWGNSIGDYFTNTAVAKQGLGAMALAGCYAGPVFNILMGFGTSLLYATSVSYPDAFVVSLDASSIISLVFLVFTLSCSIAMVIYEDFQLTRRFGIGLLIFYALYTITQGIAVAATI